MDINKYTLQPEIREISGYQDSDTVYLSIQIGNGQIGGSTVTLNGKQLAKGDLSKPTLLGAAETLKGLSLEVVTNVLDVNNFTNMCVMTTSFLNEDNKILFSKIDNGAAPGNGVASFKGIYKIVVLFCMVMVMNFLNHSPVFAQSGLDSISFEQLQTPTSPGFILLDKAPSSIERPTTPQGFGISVLGLLQGAGGSMEFAPFWLVNHPGLTVEEMYQNPFPLLYHFSISVATVKTDSSGYLSGGIRTRLFQSYSKKSLAKLDSLKHEISIALADLDVEHPDFTRLEILQQQYASCISTPVFTIDVAAAIGAWSPDNSIKTMDLSRWAAWLSFNWRPKAKDFYATALLRYLFNDNYLNYEAKTNLMDAGLRLNYDVSKFCMSLEYLQRFDFGNASGSDFRLAIVGNYAYSRNIYLTVTVGKNFSEVNNLIALAGINFGISRSKIKAF